MKVICRRDCQVRLENLYHVSERRGQIHFVQRGDVLDLDACPPNFESIEEPTYELDFSTATEDELLAAKWTAKEAKEAINELYGIELKIDKGDKKKDVVKAILDARYRSLDVEG